MGGACCKLNSAASQVDECAGGTLGTVDRFECVPSATHGRRRTDEAPATSAVADHSRRLIDADAECTPPDSFVKIEFKNSVTVRSNLGGQGGRCHETGTNTAGRLMGCDEQATRDPYCETLNDKNKKRCHAYVETNIPQEIYIREVGYNLMAGVATGEVIDLRITNLTEYHAWDTQWNGVKRVDIAGDDSFAVVNLLGPRQTDWSDYWSDQMTFVELKIEFLTRPEAWDPAKTAKEQTDTAVPIKLNTT